MTFFFSQLFPPPLTLPNYVSHGVFLFSALSGSSINHPRCNIYLVTLPPCNWQSAPSIASVRGQHPPLDATRGGMHWRRVTLCNSHGGSIPRPPFTFLLGCPGPATKMSSQGRGGGKGKGEGGRGRAPNWSGGGGLGGGREKGEPPRPTCQTPANTFCCCRFSPSLLRWLVVTIRRGTMLTTTLRLLRMMMPSRGCVTPATERPTTTWANVLEPKPLQQF